MRKTIIFIALISISYHANAQNLSIQYPAHNTVVTSSYYENDTLLLNLANSRNEIDIISEQFLNQLKVHRQGSNLIAGNYFSGVDSAVQAPLIGEFFKIDSFYFYIGQAFSYSTYAFDYIFSKNATMFIDSLSSIDVSNTGFTLGMLGATLIGALPHPLNDSSILLYGGGSIDTSQKFSYYFLEFNMYDNSFDLHISNCNKFVYIDALLYDSIQNKYISNMLMPLCPNTNSLLGRSFGYFDTNFNISAPMSDYIGLMYTPYTNTNYRYAGFRTAMEWVTDSTIMVVGNVDNPFSATQPVSANSSKYGYEIGVSIRKASDFSEVDSTKLYGNLDIAEVYERPILKKMDSNLFVTAANLELQTPSWKPWNTELALLGLNENGEKHWMRYFPFNDYCWVQEIHPDEDGGLWVVAQCLKDTSNTYEQFAKVMYIDSVAFWPRIGQITGLAETNNHINSYFKLYPNPADKSVTILKNNDGKEMEAKILDVNGRLVKTAKLEARETAIDVSELKAGIYFVKIISNGNTVTTKKLLIN